MEAEDLTIYRSILVHLLVVEKYMVLAIIFKNLKSDRRLLSLSELKCILGLDHGDVSPNTLAAEHEVSADHSRSAIQEMKMIGTSQNIVMTLIGSVAPPRNYCLADAAIMEKISSVFS